MRLHGNQLRCPFVCPNLDGGTIVRMRADNQSSAPSSPNPGQIYFDTTTNHLYVWNGTAWKQLDN